MAFEPINIFARRIDPRGVLEVMRAHAEKVTVVGPDDDWEEACAVLKKNGLFGKAKTLTLTHDSEYYDGDDWNTQIFGMQNYFSEFPDIPEKRDIMRAIGMFRFALGMPKEEFDIDGNDERLEMLFAICERLDGAIFTPSSLRDARGRILIDATGYHDPDSVLPKLPDLPPVEEGGEDLEDEDYEDEEPEPPTAERVSRRAVALAAVAARALMEIDAGEVDDPEELRGRLLAWIDETGVGDELEPEEWKVLQRPLGQLEQQDHVNAMWRIEGLVVLLWALELCDIPPYDELVSPADVFGAVGLLEAEDTKRSLAAPSLRSEEELEETAKQLLAFHWRMRDFSLRPEPMDFIAFSKDSWFGGFDLSKFRTVNGDLALGDCEITEAPAEELAKAHSTAMERHQAINWLLGYSELYSDTDTST